MGFPNGSKFLLAILNSKIGWYQITKYCTKIQNGYQLIYKYLENLSIKKIDEKNKVEQSLHDEIVQLVDTMLQLQQQKQSATLSEQLQQLEQRIAYTDDKINEKVYALYGLTEEEVNIVENKR